jgi:hypothetical protein
MPSTREEKPSLSSGLQSAVGLPPLAPVVTDRSKLMPLWEHSEADGGSVVSSAQCNSSPFTGVNSLELGSQPLSLVNPVGPSSLAVSLPGGEGSSKPPPLPHSNEPVGDESGVRKEVKSLSSEEIRNAYIGREAVVRAWGWVVFTVAVLFGCLALFATTFCVLQMIADGAGSKQDGLWVFVMMALFCGMVVATVSYGLLKLRWWCKWLIVIGALALVGSMSPVGIIVGSLVIWGLLNRRTSFVFSLHYRKVVAETPHLQYHPRLGVIVKGKVKTVASH